MSSGKWWETARRGDVFVDQDGSRFVALGQVADGLVAVCIGREHHSGTMDGHASAVLCPGELALCEPIRDENARNHVAGAIDAGFTVVSRDPFDRPDKPLRCAGPRMGNECAAGLCEVRMAAGKSAMVPEMAASWLITSRANDVLPAP